jgi:hypothetical protein
MEATSSHENSTDFQRIKQRYVPEDITISAVFQLLPYRIFSLTELGTDTSLQ